VSDIIAITFQDEQRADEVLDHLQQAQAGELLDLEDAAVVVKDMNENIHLRQTNDITAAKGAAYGGVLGLLIGMLFWLPVAGGLAGVILGAVWGIMIDLGFEDQWMKEVGGSLKPGNSALFLLVRSGTNRVIHELKQYKGSVYLTSLSDRAKAALTSALEKAPDMTNESIPT
jgi:uncharacterized membrane protein